MIEVNERCWVFTVNRDVDDDSLHFLEKDNVRGDVAGCNGACRWFAVGVIHVVVWCAAR